MGMAILAVALLLVGCGGKARTVTLEEARLGAWWCEDVARGIARVPGELHTVDASAPLLRLASWAASGPDGGVPNQLATRRKRWTAISSLLRSGLLVVVDGGFLTVAPDADGDSGRLAQRLADSENHERRSVEVLVLSLTQPDARLEQQFRQAFVQARLEGDLAAGGTRWDGPTP